MMESLTGKTIGHGEMAWKPEEENQSSLEKFQHQAMDKEFLIEKILLLNHQELNQSQDLQLSLQKKTLLRLLEEDNRIHQ